MADFLQFIFAGLTSGAIYALSAVGFTLIWNARGLINFAQGDFVMLGGMMTSVLLVAGLPLPLAILGAVAVAAVVGVLLQVLAIAPARQADHISLAIITIGASIFIQGVVSLVIGKGQGLVPSFSGDSPIRFLGAAMLPQSVWMLGVAAVVMAALSVFFRHTLTGKAMQAISINPSAAQLVGVGRGRMLALAFALAAAVSAVGGAVSAPIVMPRYDTGLLLGLKGFVGATLGGLGSGPGAVAGGLLVGLTEALVAGYLSSSYKDAVPFLMIIGVLLFMPHGLFGTRQVDRV